MSNECDGLNCKDLQALRLKFASNETYTKEALKNITLTLRDMRETDNQIYGLVRSQSESDSVHYTDLKERLAEGAVTMDNLATKDELAATNGQIKTIWILGTLLVLGYLAVTGLFIWYIKQDIATGLKNIEQNIMKHNTEASRINYQGISKVIRGDK